MKEVNIYNNIRKTQNKPSETKLIANKAKQCILNEQVNYKHTNKETSKQTNKRIIYKERVEGKTKTTINEANKQIESTKHLRKRIK